MLCLLFHDVVPFLSPKLFHDALAFSFTKHQNACPFFLYQLLLYQVLLHQTHNKPTANHLKTPTHHTHILTEISFLKPYFSRSPSPFPFHPQPPQLNWQQHHHHHHPQQPQSTKHHNQTISSPQPKSKKRF